ncbi:MAG: bis(5'-nucleosyl)-tetraphosphatase (symmetrical) YqeK [Solobacterium sp.]|jgi:nicotinate-nucleotide adenylyltransferase|nr:bis(5'-nucleosyl)-tetraphosphatase (symmetrical) YqeK [Solobacterium sp.]MCH4223205.1 bis(5'-nucleosyl)-tetraphosphatase (symmetrical) YqeK [Solobacterium sp.]MCH4266073.1 bis(5'-nucleosyl)-tetraphosphatase (symmetrical) YqeK [Solobacterium sp.]
MIAVFTLNADPITQAELQAVLACMKEKHFSCGMIRIAEEGILSKEQRIKLVQLAIRPYRKLKLSEGTPCDEIIAIDPVNEPEARAGAFNLAARGTRQYLNDHGCYYEEIVTASCKPHRAAHSRSTADLCRELALAHHLNGERAWRMGMLHDVTKIKEDDWGRSLLSVYDPDKLSMSPKIWHSFTAPLVLKQNLCLKDTGILHAIYHHTLGDGNSDLDRILYIADKCERTRGYDTEAEIKLAKQNLKEAALLVKTEQRTYLKEKEGIHA